MRPAYHQLEALLGGVDLHPGGAAATERLLDRLGEIAPQRVLDVGAGAGRTSARMRDRGWRVTALEPDRVMRRKLRSRGGLDIRAVPLLSHRAAQPYDAMIAESVLYMTDLERSFGHAARLLRSGGRLGFVDAVWTAAIEPEHAARLSAWSAETYGIPVATRQRLLWSDWLERLDAAGFDTVEATKLPAGSAGIPATRTRWETALAMLRDPRRLRWLREYDRQNAAWDAPPDSLETWLCVGVRR